MWLACERVMGLGMAWSFGLAINNPNDDISTIVNIYSR
jgi:hypothetical protein